MSKSRRAFLRDGAITIAAVSLGGQGLLGCSDSPAALPDGQQPDWPQPDGPVADGGTDAPTDISRDAATDSALDATFAKRPDTTVRQRIQGVLPSKKQPASNKQQWGVTQLVAGDLHLRQDLLQVDATATIATGPPVSLFYAAHLTDLHIIDEESPARTINLDQLLSPAWRTQEAHGTQVLDAMLRKLHKLDAFRAFDCALLTGDSIDNNQKNELGWFLDVVGGKTVVPNSGDLEDPDSGPDNDPHDSFAAKGLGTIPWYVAMGNHDALIQGNLPHGNLLGYSLITGDPTRDTVKQLDLGRVNNPTCNPILTDEAQQPGRCIPTYPGQLKSGALTADKARVHLSRKEWVNDLLYAPGLPGGHGLTNDNLSSGTADYVADPVPGLPLRLVVLDTTALATAAGAYGRVDSFLEPALLKAQQDEVLVVVVSHHYLDGIVGNSGDLRQTLNSFPNVIMHLVGHGHTNLVTPRPGVSPAHGYWEVQTCSLIEWPQQGRLIELVDRRDGTAEIWLTLTDFDTDHQPGGALAQASRFLALYEVHSGANGSGGDDEGDLGDRNVVLPVAVPQEVQKKLSALPGQPIESMLFV